MPKFESDRLLTSGVSKTDAAVFRVNGDMLGVYTVDVFAPIVDDPEDFGRIAFANCVSDVCAMGGRPVIALNVCLFPPKAPVEKLALILKGAGEAALENGVVVGGGHTTKVDELQYGLFVYGQMNRNQLRLATNARPGDHIILTKPIGTGILFAAKDHEDVGDSWEVAIESMKLTSIAASEILHQFNCDCCTDVTGFGLVPHLLEVLEESNVACEILTKKIPLFQNVEELSKKYICPVLMSNMELAKEKFDPDRTEPHWTNICFDAQTSGGLLAFINENQVEECVLRLREAGYTASDIGVVMAGEPRVTLK